MRGVWIRFAEAVFWGLVTLVLALPVVTLVPALAVGSTLVRRDMAGYPARVASVPGLFLRAVRSLWPVALAASALGGLLVMNLVAMPLTAIPGGGVVAVVSWVALGALAVGVLALAATWTEGADAGTSLQRLRDAMGRPRVPVLLALAVALAAVVVWMYPPLIVVVPGMVVFAAVAVVHGLSRESTAGRADG
ncbi:MAG: hypothetical protein QM675_04265 [Protaetiibacter sp.]